MNKTLVITGAGGFIGRRLSCRAIANGWRVVAISRKDLSGEETFQSCELRQVNSLSVEQLVDAFQDADTVVHAAAYIPQAFGSPSDTRHLFEANTIGTSNAIAAARSNNVKRFVYLSTLGNGGIFKVNPEEIITEGSALQPAGSASDYLISKIAGEMIVESSGSGGVMSTCTIRLASVYGPGMSAEHLVSKWLRQSLQQRGLVVHNGGLNSTNLVYIDDVVDSILRACSLRDNGVFHLASNHTIRIKDVAQQIIKVTNANISQLEIEEKKTPASPQIRYDIRKAEKFLRWCPRDLTSGLIESFKTIAEL